jgi:hypothetical protein
MGRQFVIQMDNRPGELAHLARALGARGIDIHQVASVGAGTCASMFMTTTDPEGTRHVLRGLGRQFMEGDLITVHVEDRPGGLADVSERLAKAGVNIVGVMTVGRRPGWVEMTFAVDDEPKARAALGLGEPDLVVAGH